MRNRVTPDVHAAYLQGRKIQLTYPLVCEFISALRIEVETGEDELNILCLEGAEPRSELKGLIEVTRNTPDRYNDCVIIAWTDIEGTHLETMKATTEPGRYYTTINPHPGGAAHLVWGRHLYKRGRHRGKPALVSATGMNRVWRDRDADFSQDIDEMIYKGRFGIHVHAGGSSRSIGRWSAGCVAICGGYEGEPYSFFTERINAHPGKVISLTLWGARDLSRWFKDREVWRPTLRYGIRNPWVAGVQGQLNRHLEARLVVDGD